MDFTFQQEITKDFLLSKFSEETIFCHYLNISQIPRKLIISPVREDKRPTCGFYRNQSGTLILHDFATGEYMNCFSLVMKMYGLTFHQALKLIAKDFGLLATEITPIKVVKKAPVFIDEGNITRIQVELDEFSDSDLAWWNQFGISKKTLDKYRVFSCKTIFLNGNIYAKKAQHNPIYGYYFGKKGDLEQWRIYFPQRKEMRFIGNVPTKTIQGFKQLPKTGKYLVITKSMKDVMLFHELGIPACAPNSETQFVSDSVLTELHKRFEKICLLYDNDLTGIKFTNKLRKEHPDLIPLLIPRKYACKDISDFYKKYGKAETNNLVEQGVNYIELLWRLKKNTIPQLSLPIRMEQKNSSTP